MHGLGMREAKMPRKRNANCVCPSDALVVRGGYRRTVSLLCAVYGTFQAPRGFVILLIWIDDLDMQLIESIAGCAALHLQLKLSQDASGEDDHSAHSLQSMHEPCPASLND